MGFTLVYSWKCPYKQLSCHTLVLHGGYSGWPMKLHMKSQCFSTHWHCMGFTLVDSWTCPCKDTTLPHIGITWASHWLTHEIAHVKFWLAHEPAHVKPLFCKPLALHGLHIFGPWHRPCITIVSPHIGITWASHRLAHDIAHVKATVCHSLVLSGAHIGWPMKLPIWYHCFTTHWWSKIFYR